ncbi:MAG: hypothetical protein R3B47_03960 [Bacteroidia bacterium]
MKYVFPFILILLTLAGCTGFEDGPKISFADPATIIANEWAVREAIKRGTDITAEYASDVLTFEEQGAFSYLETSRIVTNPPFTRRDTITVIGTGSWDFLDGKDEIEILYKFEFKDLYDPENITYTEERYE